MIDESAMATSGGVPTLESEIIESEGTRTAANAIAMCGSDGRYRADRVPGAEVPASLARTEGRHFV